MTTIINPNFRNIGTLQRQIEALKEHVHLGSASPLSTAEIEGLLEGAQEKIHALRNAEDTLSGSTLNALDEEIISLFGDLKTQAEKEAAAEIQEEEQKLQTLLQGGNPRAIAEEATLLSGKIKEYSEQHPRPARENKRILALAQKSVSEAREFISEKVLGNTINKQNILELQGIFSQEEDAEEQIMLMFEIAEALYFNRMPDARRDLFALSIQAKRRFYHHLEKLGLDPRYPYAQKMGAIQALMASTEELATEVEVSHYMTEQEIEQMYGEVSALANSL